MGLTRALAPEVLLSSRVPQSLAGGRGLQDGFLLITCTSLLLAAPAPGDKAIISRAAAPGTIRPMRSEPVALETVPVNQESTAPPGRRRQKPSRRCATLLFPRETARG